MYRDKRCRAPDGSGQDSGFFVKINADFERSAECVGQTHGVQRSDNISLLLLPKEDQS